MPAPHELAHSPPPSQVAPRAALAGTNHERASVPVDFLDVLRSAAVDAEDRAYKSGLGQPTESHRRVERDDPHHDKHCAADDLKRQNHPDDLPHSEKDS